MCSQFGFVIFWRKDFGTKAGHKMLVKLTPGLTDIAITTADNLFTELATAVAD